MLARREGVAGGDLRSPRRPHRRARRAAGRSPASGWCPAPSLYSAPNSVAAVSGSPPSSAARAFIQRTSGSARLLGVVADEGVELADRLDVAGGVPSRRAAAATRPCGERATACTTSRDSESVASRYFAAAFSKSPRFEVHVGLAQSRRTCRPRRCARPRRCRGVCSLPSRWITTSDSPSVGDGAGDHGALARSPGDRVHGVDGGARLEPIAFGDALRQRARRARALRDRCSSRAGGRGAESGGLPWFEGRPF